MKSLLIILAISTILSGCTDAAVSQLGGLGSRHKIELYSGGKLVGEWIATGKVLNSSNSDGYHFKDEASKVNIEISGDVIITRLPDYTPSPKINTHGR